MNRIYANSVKVSRLITLIVIALISFVSCTKLENVVMSLAPEDADKFAREYIDLLSKGNFVEVKELTSPEVANSISSAQMEGAQKGLNREEVISFKIVKFLNAQNKFTNEKRVELTYLREYSKSWDVLNLVIQEKQPGEKLISGFKLNSFDESMIKTNKFSLTNKSLKHYFFLIFAIAIPILIIYANVLCFRSKIKRKWLWIIFILFGVGKLSINWTSGEVTFSLINFLMLGVSYMRPFPFYPAILSVCFPLGAIIFILKKRNPAKNNLSEIQPQEPSDLGANYIE